MGVVTCSYEFKSSIPVSKFFKAIVLDTQNLFPKVMPQAIKSIELVEGDGGVGSVTQTNFVDGLPFKFIKHKIDAIDASNHSIKYTTIDGDKLADHFEKIVYEAKYEAAGEGCVCKVQTHYHSKGTLTEDAIRAEHAREMEVFKMVEQYLLANPTCV